MPLTPADVHNVAFKKPPIGKRGYDEEEVDAFLDEVERELARLIEENNELRAQLERGGGGRPAGPGADPRLASELAETKAQLDRVQRDKAAAEQAARQMQAELEQVRPRARVGAGPTSPAATASSRPCGSDDGPAHRRRPRVGRPREADKLLSDARSKAGGGHPRGLAPRRTPSSATRASGTRKPWAAWTPSARAAEAHRGAQAVRARVPHRLKAYLESPAARPRRSRQGLEAEMSRADANRRSAAPAGLAAAGLAGSYGGSRTGAIESGR
jgi:DivIVA domain-containing protein